jgi:hypothetical protein
MTRSDNDKLDSLIRQLEGETNACVVVEYRTLPTGEKRKTIINDTKTALEYLRTRGEPTVVEHLQAAKGLFYLIIGGTFLIALAFILAGIALVMLGATGTSQISILGATISTSNVGLGSIFLGAVVIIWTIRSAMKNIRDILRQPPRGG